MHGPFSSFKTLRMIARSLLRVWRIVLDSLNSKYMHNGNDPYIRANRQKMLESLRASAATRHRLSVSATPEGREGHDAGEHFEHAAADGPHVRRRRVLLPYNLRAE
jgi:hypothetical protein